MPLLFSLGQHAGLKAVQEGLIAGERLFCILGRHQRASGHVHALLHTDFRPDYRERLGVVFPGGASVARVWFASVGAGHPRSGYPSGSPRARQCPVIGDHHGRGFLLFLMLSQLGLCSSIVQGRVLIAFLVSFVLSWSRASLNDTQ